MMVVIEMTTKQKEENPKKNADWNQTTIEIEIACGECDEEDPNCDNCNEFFAEDVTFYCDAWWGHLCEECKKELDEDDKDA